MNTARFQLYLLNLPNTLVAQQNAVFGDIKQATTSRKQKIPSANHTNGIFRLQTSAFRFLLFLSEINLNRNAGKIKVIAQLVFDIPFIRFFNVLRQIGK